MPHKGIYEAESMQVLAFTVTHFLGRGGIKRQPGSGFALASQMSHRVGKASKKHKSQRLH